MKSADIARDYEHDPPTGADEFPIGCLPDPMRQYVAASGAALQCNSAYVALPALAAAAASIGITRAIRLCETWSEFPIVWAGIVGLSGSRKTPALDAALFALRAAEKREYAAHCRAVESHNAGLGGGPGKRDVRAGPTCTRRLTSDPTVAALAPLLSENPRGLLLARDELSGWLLSFNQFKGGGRGDDLPNFLSMHGAGPILVDRKGPPRMTIRVDRAALSICGGIQPGILKTCMTPENMQSGLLARILLCMPDHPQKRWRPEPFDNALRDAFDKRTRDLLTLDFVAGPDGDGAPLDLTLSESAAAYWASWYDRHAETAEGIGNEAEAAAHSKMEAAAARLSLIHCLFADPWATAIGGESMEAGCALADWFGAEFRRVYRLLGVDDARAVASGESLATWIVDRGGQCTVRDLMRSQGRKYPNAEKAESALVAAAANGHLERDGGTFRATRR